MMLRIVSPFTSVPRQRTPFSAGCEVGFGSNASGEIPVLATTRLIGQKPPLRPKHVWSIRARLQMEGRTRDLAMFNLAIDSNLRGCDVVSIRVEDVASADIRSIAQQCGRGRRVGPSGLS